MQLAQNAITKSGVEMKRTRRGWSVDESRMAKDWKRTKRRGRGPPNLSESTATSPQARCREARCTGVGLRRGRNSGETGERRQIEA